MTEPYKPTKTPLTARETEMIVIAMQCIQGCDIKVSSLRPFPFPPLPTVLPHAHHNLTPLQIDYEKFAKMADYGSKNNAQDDDGVGAAAKSSPKKRGKKEQGGEPAGKRAKKSSVKVEEEEHREVEANKGAEVVKQEGEGEGEFFEAAVESGGDVEV
ncbi:MAG: hypothetical protein L6R38_007902 [Xanthoria sp. 2 TBL-2021]|nr:MAG: hypothetical protein L6R38_007902 [Xanthoria sp. 2 TBL-2021]